MPNELCQYSTKLFAEKIIPQMRGIWKDYEDHWSPTPMPKEDRAVPRMVTMPDKAGQPLLKEAS